MSRDKELPRRGAQRTPLPDLVEEEEELHQPPEDYEFELEQYTTDCFVDIDVMLAYYASLARGTFIDDMGRDVTVIVPTNSFFPLHTLDPNAPRLWPSLSLEGYFTLPAWGPDLRRSWEVLCTLTDKNTCIVIDFEGNQLKITLDRALIRQALNLTEGQLAFNQKAHKSNDRERCSDTDKPTWDELNCQEIRLALQLYTQHFQIPYPHRWSLASRSVVIEFTNRQVLNTPINVDYVSMWLWNLKRAAKSNITLAKTTAKRPPKPYLGAVLALTRIVYYALNCMDELPRPWTQPGGAAISSKALQDTEKERKKAQAEEKKRKRKERAKKMEAALSPRSPRKDRSKKQKEQAHTEDSEELGHDQDDDFDQGDYFEESLLHKENESCSDKAKAFMDEELQRQMEQLNIPKDYGVFLTEEEIKVLREITISMSQDHELVVNLRRAADLMTQERKQNDKEEEAKQEADRIAAREKARKQREEEMKTKGKEKAVEVEGSSKRSATPPLSPAPDMREQIMIELKEALEREDLSRQERHVPEQPLEGILDSFVKFYTDLKAKSQQIEETTETRAQELQQYKKQAEATNSKNKKLETSLESALTDRKLYREELEYALHQNVLYAAKRQLDVDQLSLANRAARRELNKTRQDKEVLGTALSFANDRLDEARNDLLEEKNKAVEWVTNKVALEEDLRQRQSYAAELERQVERLTTGYETATTSLENMQQKLDEIEK